jgi:hypothetical protein
MVSRVVGKKKIKREPGIEKNRQLPKKRLRGKKKPLTKETDPWGTVSSHP